MKQQHILLFSDHPRATAELPLRRDARYQLTHCARGDREVDVIDRVQQRFDWILVDGALMDGDQTEFVETLRAMGLLFRDRGGGECNHHSCKVEWDTNGILQLHCSKRASCAGFQSDRHGYDTDGFVFEYHAPMKRTG